MKITLSDMHFFAYHGFYPEEQANGNDFKVNITLELPAVQAATNDNLDDTLNYELVYNVVKEEMAQTSKLLEHVAARIKTRLLNDFKLILSAKVIVSKKNPPLGGPVDWVSVEI